MTDRIAGRMSQLSVLALAAATAGCTMDSAPRPRVAAAPPEIRDCPECPPMVAIPAGRFMMGSPAGEEGRQDNEGPQIRVQVAAFAVARHETTFAEWDACAADGGCSRRPPDEGWGRGDRPVINVSWNDAQAYAAWLSRKTGKAYRLLSEAEWEYGARAGAGTQYSWGSIASHEYANYGQDDCCGGFAAGRDQWIYTAPVEAFPANAFGLYGMFGNVWEWVEDCWEESHSGRPADHTARKTGNCRLKVMRGGSWASLPVKIRAAHRELTTPDDRDSIIGFRVARSN